MCEPCPQDPAQRKLERLLDPYHPLRKEEAIWLLEYIKKSVTEEDPQLLELPQPRLMRNFRYFAEIAMLLLHKHTALDQDAVRLKQWLGEAAYGLYNPIPRQPTASQVQNTTDRP